MNFEEDNPPQLEPPEFPAPVTKPPGSGVFLSSSLPGEAGTAEDVGAPSAGSLIPEDLRTPWDWLDLIIFALLSLGGTLFVSIAVLVLFTMVLHVSPMQLRNSSAARTYFAIANQIALSILLLAFIAVQIRTRAPLPYWRTLGWRPLRTGHLKRPVLYLGLIGSGFLLAFAIEFVSSFFHPKGKLPIEIFFQDRRSAFILMLVSVLLAPLFEETIFRGYIYPAIARRLGIAASVIITGTLFGMLHAPQLWGGWVQIGLLVLVGVIFTYARAKSGTVVASYLLHLSYNSFLFFGFLVGTFRAGH